MRGEEKQRPGERVFALILILLSGYVLSEAYGISGFNGLTTGGVMPMVAASIMLLSSLFILVETWRRPAADEPSFRSLLNYLFPLRVVLVAALLAIYAVLIPPLGFLVASGGFLFVTIWLLWQRGPLWSLLIAGLSMAAIHILFRMVFQVVLPSGTLWQ